MKPILTTLRCSPASRLSKGRLAVEFIVDLLAQGWTEAQILENYPGIAREDIRACLQYASEMLKSERVFPVSARS